MAEIFYERVVEWQNGNAESALYILHRFTPLLKHYAFLLKREDLFFELQCKLLEVLKNIDFDRMHSHSDGAIVNYIQKSIRNEYIQLAYKTRKDDKITSFDDLSPYEEVECQIKCSTEERYETLLLDDIRGILTKTEYNVIYYLFFQNYSVREVSEILGKTRQAINETKLAALAKLRKKL